MIVLSRSGLSNLSSCLIFGMWLSKLLHTPIFKAIELNFAVMYVGCVNYFANIFSPFLVVNNLEFTSSYVYNFYFGTIVVINKELTPRCVRLNPYFYFSETNWIRLSIYVYK
jgi:hypothetical protein